MKRPALFPLALAAALWAPAHVYAQATGKEAMNVVVRDRGADYNSRFLHLFGENGIPQPQVWRVVARDRQHAVREFYVTKGRIVAEGVVPPAQANGIGVTPLPTHRLNIDSSGAFEKAEQAARAAKVGFDRLHYQLRCLELSTNAAWFLTLVDARGMRVGEISIGASTGTVLTQNWFPRPLPPLAQNQNPPPRQQPPPPVIPPYHQPEEPGFWDRAKKGFSRGANSVRKGVGNAAGWVQRKVTPESSPPPPPPRYVVPPQR